MNQTMLIRILSVHFLIFSIGFNANAQTNIAPSAEETNPVQAGATAPDFTVYQVDGAPYEFKAGNLERPTMLITFRGAGVPTVMPISRNSEMYCRKLNKAGLTYCFSVAIGRKFYTPI